MKASRRGPVLIVASGSSGHRQSYVAVLGRWFAETGHSVVIACGPDGEGTQASRTPILAEFLSTSNAVGVDLESEAIQDPIRFRTRLSRLETELKPAWTLLVNGDECLRALGGKWPRNLNHSRRAAIFIYFAHEHPLDLREYSYLDKIRPWARQRLDRRRQRGFFKRDVWAKLGLDVILATDEYAVAALSHPHIRYLPEIYRAWGSDTGPEPLEIEEARVAYAAFMRRHSGKDVLLYYGGRFMRRGYDTLQALVLEYEDTVFVDVGRDVPGQVLSEAAERGREKLAMQGRLFRWDIPFLPDNHLVDDLFGSARFVVLPYRDWYGVSGSMYQAASYGCPVLVPDVGYMGSAVSHYRNGLTYRHGDCPSLRRQFDQLRDNPTRFKESALRFSRRADKSAVFSALAAAFECEGRIR